MKRKRSKIIKLEDYLDFTPYIIRRDRRNGWQSIIHINDLYDNYNHYPDDSDYYADDNLNNARSIGEL